MKHESTIVAADNVIYGNIEGRGDVIVHGRVEGNLRIGGQLTIELTGYVRANVQAHGALISGTLEGNVEADEAVEITSEGRVVGDIKAPEVTIGQGASFRGSVNMGELAPRPEPREAPPLRPSGRFPLVAEASRRHPEPRPAAAAPRPSAPVAAARPAAPEPRPAVAAPKAATARNAG